MGLRQIEPVRFVTRCADFHVFDATIFCIESWNRGSNSLAGAMLKRNENHRALSVLLTLILIVSITGYVQPALATGTCGTGSWTPGNLEIHHINVGQGDSALIVGPTGKSLLFDAGESNWNSSAQARVIGPYIETVLGCMSLDYVVISHFHVDHIGYVGYGGLWHLVEVQGFTVGTTLLRSYNTHLGAISGTFTNWKTYLAGAGQAKLHPTTVVEGTGQVDLGPGVSFKILAVDGNGAIIPGDFHGDASPPSENDYSIGAVISFGAFDEWIGGDLSGHYAVGGFGYTYHDIELSTAPEVGDIDVYKVNHHGSSHSNSATFISQLDPEVSIVTVGNGNIHGHPAQMSMDRLLATSTVYMTERGDPNTNVGSAIIAGNIVIKTSNGSLYTVNSTSYTATEPIRTDADGDGYFAEADPVDSNAGLIPAPNGGCGPIYQTCAESCQVNPGQVVINEVLPAPSVGAEWVELYNLTSSTVNIGHCYIDDIAAGSPAYQIPTGTLIPPYGFWTLDRTTYFNNPGDDVRFLKEDASTVLDTYSYGSTGYNLSWYRLPDGGPWAASATASTTKGLSNTVPFYPIVSSSHRAGPNPTNAVSVDFSVTFSKTVTGVDLADFLLASTGITGAAITNVNGSGTGYTVTVSTGTGNGTLRLDVVDNDSIRDISNVPLGGAGTGNGAFSAGESYDILKTAVISGNVGIAGTQLQYTDGTPKAVVADGNGGYTLIVPYHWAGPVTPSHPCYSFSPVSLNYEDVTAPQTSQDYIPTFNPASGCAQINVDIGGINQGSYGVPPQGSQRVTYPVDAGPVKLYSTNGVPIIAALRDAFFAAGGQVESFAQLMGLPEEQLSDTYYFPAYNNVTLSGQLRFANVDSIDTEVTVTIGGQLQGTYPLQPNQSQRVSYPLDTGPVVVKSSNGAKIIVALRDAFSVGGRVESFVQLMGLPKEQLADTYYFPAYNNVTLSGQLRFANVDTMDTQVTVTIGGQPQGTYPLGPNQSQRVSYPLDTGPVVVESSNGAKIIVALRDAFSVGGRVESFVQLMGLPEQALSDAYVFPAYNNVTLSGQLRFANVDSIATDVTVTIGGQAQPPITLQPGGSQRVSYPLDAGPVVVESSNGAKIIVALRDAFLVNGQVVSFVQLMGLPQAALSDTYYFPAYNNVTLSGQLRFGVP
jgi:beta-lactamase superfamily II metal-dependent hydrolase